MPLILEFAGIKPKIADDVFIAENAVIIGDVVIGSGSSIWYNCVLRGDVNYIRVGCDTNIQDGTVIHVNRDNGPTIIGDNVTIGHCALLHACRLESNSFVGMGATVMDYAVIRGHGMIAAGALLTPNKEIKAGELWAGRPAKLFRMLTDEEIGHIKVSKNNYVELANIYKKSEDSS